MYIDKGPPCWRGCDLRVNAKLKFILWKDSIDNVDRVSLLPFCACFGGVTQSTVLRQQHSDDLPVGF